MQIENLHHRYILARWSYSLGEPILTDIDYDELHKYLVQAGELQEYTGRSWADDPMPLDLLTQYDLYSTASHRPGNTERVTTSSMASLTTMGEVKVRFGNMATRHHVSIKHDGWSAQVIYSNGQLTSLESRGRSDTTPVKVEGVHPRIPYEIPNKGAIVVVGELTLSSDGMKELQRRIQETRRSQRGAVRTAIAHGHLDLLNFAAFTVWESNEPMLVEKSEPLLQSWGFDLAELHEYVGNYDELEKLILSWSRYKKYLSLPSDGLVCRNCLTNEMVALRVEGWKQGLYKSYIKGYEDSYAGMYISQLVNIHPVDSKDATHKVIPVTNIGYLVRYNLLPGAPIAFTLTSDAIAVFSVDNTQLLHMEWEGRWDEYKEKVEAGLL
jgi:NAD-dependent DNA ligase